MQVYLVGGAVRDQLLGRPVNERDWVVVGATPEQMQQLGYRGVGRDFPVYLHPQTHEEYALARRERKVGPGYRGFTTQFSPDVTLEQDLQRRDLTINAIAQDPDGKLIDPFGGQRDLAARSLRHVSAAFVEDPVRSENPEVLAAFRPQVRVPVAVGEQYGDRWDINTLIERHLIDYTRVTLPNVGGITEWVKIAALCETHYIGMIPHFTGPVAVAALVHVLSTFPGPALLEVTGEGPKLPPHLSAGCEFRQGKLWPVNRPGLGVEFDPSGAEMVLEVTERSAPIPTYCRPDGSFTNW